ncbi:zinc ribbon domain-containing protein, partial [Propioniciclava flava]
MFRCPECGHETAEAVNFCPNCGAALKTSTGDA